MSVGITRIMNALKKKGNCFGNCSYDEGFIVNFINIRVNIYKPNTKIYSVN
jgi:hypothetical protein